MLKEDQGFPMHCTLDMEYVNNTANIASKHHLSTIDVYVQPLVVVLPWEMLPVEGQLASVDVMVGYVSLCCVSVMLCW